MRRAVNTFRRLEIFLAVYKTKSFSKAARELFLAQPTVSIQVKMLEKALNVKLFDRHGSSISSTPDADKLYLKALKIKQFDDLKAELVSPVELVESLQGDLRRIAEIAGLEAALKIGQEFKGVCISTAGINSFQQKIRDEAIRRGYDSGEQVLTLCRRYGLTERQIRRILSEASINVPDHIFGLLGFNIERKEKLN